MISWRCQWGLTGKGSISLNSQVPPKELKMVLFAPKHLFFVPRQKRNNRFWRCAFSNKIRKVIFDPPSGLFEKEVNSQLSDWSILQQYTSIWLKHRQPWASSSKGVVLVVVKGKGWSLIATWTNNHKQSHRFRRPMSTGICYRCGFGVTMGRVTYILKHIQNTNWRCVV